MPYFLRWNIPVFKPLCTNCLPQIDKKSKIKPKNPKRNNNPTSLRLKMRMIKRNFEQYM